MRIVCKMFRSRIKETEADILFTLCLIDQYFSIDITKADIGFDLFLCSQTKTWMLFTNFDQQLGIHYDRHMLIAQVVVDMIIVVAAIVAVS